MDEIQKLLLSNGKGILGRKSLYKVNEDVFKEPLSPLALYFLGILYTDGCIWRDKNASYRIQLGLNDYDVIDKFIEFTEYTGITHFDSRNKTPRKIVQITSEKLGQSLIDLGCVPVKTFIIEAPTHIANSRDFWRGCIDGDGSLTMNRGFSLNISLRTASEKFANQFIEFALSHDIKVGKHNDGCYKLSTYGDNSHKLAKILYKDCCFAMKRKLDIYLKHSNKD